MAEYLILKNEHPESSHRDKGDIVEEKEDGFFKGNPSDGADQWNHFVLVKVPGMETGNYRRRWRQLIDWEITSSDMQNDTFELRVWNTTASVTLKGALTRDQIETFLNKWGATVLSVSANDVNFRANIFDAVQSPGFWKIRTNVLSNIDFQDKYNRGLGIHEITATYPAQWEAQAVEDRVVSRGGIVQSHDAVAGELIFTITRQEVFAEFKQAVLMGVTNIIKKFRYYIAPAAVDFIVAQGGVYETDQTTFLSYLRNKLDE